jgi:hypothetical protein
LKPNYLGGLVAKPFGILVTTSPKPVSGQPVNSDRALDTSAFTISNVSLKTPVFIAAKQPTDLRIAAVVTASSDVVLSNSEPQTLRVSITLEGGKPMNTEYCIPALDAEDRKALREGKPRRVLIGTDSRTFARVGDIAEGVKAGDPSGTYMLNLKPGIPPNDQGQNVVVFFNDARRRYEAVPLKQHSCGSSNVGWIRLEEKKK